VRSPDPFDRTSLVGSVLVHGAALALIFWSSTREKHPLEFITYQIDLVSPPPALQAPEPQESQDKLVIERPDPTPPQPEKAKPVVEEKPKPKPAPPKPEPKKPAEQPTKAADEKKAAAAVETPPAEKPKESGEGINVRMEGLRRDFPEYYGNIITQINRCFRWTVAGRWETTVYFVIKRDGTVTDMDFVKKSGNPEFDFEALGAIDCAGKGRFGELPKELPFDRLPIQFKFQPRGGGGEPPLVGESH
jgi:protein TonB